MQEILNKSYSSPFVFPDKGSGCASLGQIQSAMSGVIYNRDC